MFKLLPILSVALVSASSASALVVPRASVVTGDWPVPTYYDQGYLEPYDTYKSRYLTLDCEAQHDTSFFAACCHPMLATETLAKNRAPECNPANLPSSSLVSSTHAPTSTASAAQPTSTDTDEDDCGADDESSDPTDGNDDDDDCDDGEDDGEDDGDDCDDETSSVVPSATSAPVHSSSVHPTSSAHSSAATTAPASVAPVNVAPLPSVSSAPAPHPTSEAHSSSASEVHTSAPAPSKTSTHAAAPSPSPTSEVFTDGFATFFFQGGNAGACGQFHSDSDVVAAIDIQRYGNTGVKSSLCGQKVQITNQNNGKTVVVPIEDACPGCKNRDSIDLSVGAFTQIATEEEGEVPISWFFVDGDSN